MKETSNNKGILLVIALILIASISRILPHWPNFTAVGATALFGAAVFNKKYLAFLVPLATLWFTDLLINNVVYTSESFVFFQSFQIYTLLAMALIVGMGLFLFKKVSPAKVVGGSLIASLIFFLVSNFGAWVSPYAMFPKSFVGLIETYIAGLPFALNDIAGTLFFSTVLFGTYFIITSKFPKLKLAKVYSK